MRFEHKTSHLLLSPLNTFFSTEVQMLDQRDLLISCCAVWIRQDHKLFAYVSVCVHDERGDIISRQSFLEIIFQYNVDFLFSLIAFLPRPMSFSLKIHCTVFGLIWDFSVA